MGTVEWIVVTVVGFGAGIGLGYWLSKWLRGDEREKLADTEAEFAAYKEEVSQHFSQSAAHFQAIGKQYRELYAHMAKGSEKLCEIADTDGQLQFPRPDEVILAKEAVALSGVAASSAGPDEPPGEAANAEVATTEAQVGGMSGTPEQAANDADDEKLSAESQDSEDTKESTDDGDADAQSEPVAASTATEVNEADASAASEQPKSGTDGDASRGKDAEQMLEANPPVDYVKDEIAEEQAVASDASRSDEGDNIAKAVDLDDVKTALKDSADESDTRLYH